MPAPTVAQPSAPESIVEAQGWVRGRNGKIYLVNQAVSPPVEAMSALPPQCQPFYFAQPGLLKQATAFQN